MVFLKTLTIFVVSILIVSCSSSSIKQRYKTISDEENKLKKSVRFSSDNDEALYRNEFDEEPIEDHPVNVEKFIVKNEPHYISPQKLTIREQMMMEIVKYLNTPYQYGGNNSNGIDCSAFTQNVFSKSLNHKLLRTASQQFQNGEKILSKSSLKFGDLVFFNTTKDSFPGHVGIILGEDLFAHASFSKGVTVSSLQSSYFKTRYVGARRQLEIK